MHIQIYAMTKLDFEFPLTLIQTARFLFINFQKVLQFPYLVITESNVNEIALKLVISKSK
jgi:hypothetical protein